MQKSGEETTALVPREEVGITRAGIDKTKNELALLEEFVDSVLLKDKDYGIIPGTQRDSLWKAGADNIIAAMRCHSESHQTAATVNPETGFVIFQYEAVIRRNDSRMVVAQGVGCCTNQEVKYRYREEQRKCPRCSQSVIIKGKEEYGGGWLCWKRNGGCGAKFSDGDPAIEGQKTGRVENPDPLDQTNTIMKMAEKRAVVDAALKLPGVARFFSQDLEAQTGEPALEDPEKPAQQPARQGQGKNSGNPAAASQTRARERGSPPRRPTGS